MTHDIPHAPEPSEAAIYQIRLKGQLGAQWAGWFEGLSMTFAENGDTLLTGLVADQAALHGVLRKVRDLGMTLLSVICVSARRDVCSPCCSMTNSKEGNDEFEQQ